MCKEILSINNKVKDALLKSEVDITEELQLLYADLYSEMRKLCKEEQLEEVQLLENMHLVSSWKIAVTVKYLIINITMDVNRVIEYLKYLLNNKSIIPKDTLYFLLCQICALTFANPEIDNLKVKELQWKLSKIITDYYVDSLPVNKMQKINREDRNNEYVFVFTNQFLSMMHGPTKTALDRCYVLVKKMNKKVILINTSECLSLVGAMWLPNLKVAGYEPKHNEATSYLYEGINIPFFQCEKIMPNESIIESFVDLVRSKKPAYIISIGGDDVTSNIMSRIVPVLTVGLCPSALSPTSAQCQTYSGVLTQNDYNLLKEMDLPDWHIISSVFTSSLKKQENVYNRKNFGYDNNDFIAAIVGARLNTDITEDFLAMMNESAKRYNVKFLLMGEYSFDKEKENSIYQKYPNLCNNMKYIGFVNDVLGHMEMADVFVSPMRRGGGTSAIEALSKGLPVLSTRFGDTMTGVGEDFLTDSYETMVELLGRYTQDKEFYEMQSQKAIERANLMLDSSTEFVKILKKFEDIIIEHQL